MIGRIAALGAVVIAVVVVAVLILSSSSSYQVNAIFQNASQIVAGDQVEVAGNSVGTVSQVKLTGNNTADLVLNISNSNYKPLHEGTIATVRLLSLSGIANRYIDLRLGTGGSPAIPNNGTIPSTDTTSAVDIDEIFDTLNQRTLKGLQDVIQGSASQYDKEGAAVQQALAYLNPSLVATATEFREINRDTSRFTNFIVKTSHLVTDLATRSGDLSGLIQHLSTVTEALQAQQNNLALSIQRLPGFMRLANTTFVNLRSALTDLTPLVNVSKPVVPKLTEYLQQLRPLAVEAVPVVHNLATLICRPNVVCSPQSPGQGDLIQLTELGVPLAAAACGTGPGATDCLGKVFADGKLRPAAFNESALSLNHTSPEIAVDRPYSADLTGWFEGYSHVGVIDANGGASRIETVFGLQSLGAGATAALPIPTGLTGFLEEFLGSGSPTGKPLVVTNQGDRCPGSIERGGVWYPNKGYPCNPHETPTGS